MAKSKDIELWMPLYIADYLADTTRLTTEQHGAYMLLIMDYWRNGSLPDDDNVLANITKLSIQAWRKHRSSIAKLFQVVDGEWKHKRIEKEIANASENSKVAKERAKKGAAARWKDRNKNDSSNAQEHHKQSSNDAQSNASSINQAQLEQCSTYAPSPSPSPNIKTLSLGANEYSPSIELVNTKLKMSGQSETSQTELNQILVQFNLKTSHLHKTDNEKLGSLLTWFRNERRQNVSAQTKSSTQKSRLDFDSVLEQQNQMRDVTPVGVIDHEQ